MAADRKIHIEITSGGLIGGVLGFFIGALVGNELEQGIVALNSVGEWLKFGVEVINLGLVTLGGIYLGNQIEDVFSRNK